MKATRAFCLALQVALFLLMRSRAKGMQGKIRNTDTTVRCKAGRGFININEHNKKYSLKSRNDTKITTKFIVRFSKKDILTCIQRIPLTTCEYVVPSLRIMSGLGNMLLFMYFLNLFRLINRTHRNVLIDITEKINSNIFLFNTISDVVNMIPKEMPTFCILSFFSLTQLLSHTFLSRLMSYLFYSKEEREGNVTVIREKQIGTSSMGDFQSCGSTKGGENNPKDGSITIVGGVAKGVVKGEGIHENSSERIAMLKHMCTLSHTGLVTMYVFNRIQKSLNCCNDNMSVFINFYTLVSGLLSKLYICFFVKKKKLIPKNLLLFFLVQSMTPPNYGVYFLSVRQKEVQNRPSSASFDDAKDIGAIEKLEGLESIRKPNYAPPPRANMGPDCTHIHKCRNAKEEEGIITMGIWGKEENREKKKKWGEKERETEKGKKIKNKKRTFFVHL
ncbi:conserved Plasmodium membrane protein, unknown function [Plasmodium ovale curtisi]|nr:conserved Plasmodium membrane protein, unknown function [Plasmodium ovale curtisi]